MPIGHLERYCENGRYDNHDRQLFTNKTETTANPEFSVENEKGKYRSLSAGEMEYLLRSRGKVLIAYGVTVMGKENCLILYPDDYKGEKVSNGDKTTYNDEDVWIEAQNEGVVCFPAAGYYWDDTYGIEEQETRANYWTSSVFIDQRYKIKQDLYLPEYDWNAYKLDIYKIGGSIYYTTKFAAYSLRLVTELEPYTE